jgi:hypothetical protein
MSVDEVLHLPIFNVGHCAVFKRRRGRPAGVSRHAVPEN